MLALIVSKTTPIACCKFSTRDAQAKRMQEVMTTTAKTVSSRLAPRNKPEEPASTTEPVVIVSLCRIGISLNNYYVRSSRARMVPQHDLDYR